MSFQADISAFFEADAPSIPNLLPISLAQTEIGAGPASTRLLLGQEELRQCGPTRRSDRDRARHSPYPSTSGRKPAASPANLSIMDSDNDSPVPGSEDEDDDDDDCNAGLIPKPEGEAGRPKSGGYSLREALDWDEKDYTKVKVSKMSVSIMALIE